MRIYKLALEACPEEYGYNLSGDPRVARVNWGEVDVQILDSWDEYNVEKFLGLADDAIIYQTLADINDLDESLVEEQDEDGEEGDYDWSEMQISRTLPPPIVITRTKDGNVVINDGNHRVRFWKRQGKEYVPAWCYDELITEWIRRNPEAPEAPEDENIQNS